MALSFLYSAGTFYAPLFKRKVEEKNKETTSIPLKRSEQDIASTDLSELMDLFACCARDTT